MVHLMKPIFAERRSTLERTRQPPTTKKEETIYCKNTISL
jgi:hypothetical protein